MSLRFEATFRKTSTLEATKIATLCVNLSNSSAKHFAALSDLSEQLQSVKSQSVMFSL
jgi:hypothetical protein